MSNEKTKKTSSLTDAKKDYLLGNALVTGLRPVGGKASDGVKFLKSAYKKGHAPAAMRLALVYKTGSFDVERNDRLAIKWLRLAAKSPEMRDAAEGELAILLYDSNAKEAIAIIERRAARKLRGPALYCRAAIYFYKGVDGTADYEKAYGYARLAAMEGCTSAYALMALCHYTGSGAARDPDLAFVLLRSALMNCRMFDQCEPYALIVAAQLSGACGEIDYNVVIACLSQEFYCGDREKARKTLMSLKEANKLDFKAYDAWRNRYEFDRYVLDVCPALIAEAAQTVADPEA